jgi:hypothetical protein
VQILRKTTPNRGSYYRHLGNFDSDIDLSATHGEIKTNFHYEILDILPRNFAQYLPRSNSFSSRLASFLSLRSCFSISWFIRFCSSASSERQQAILKSVDGHNQLEQTGPPVSIRVRKNPFDATVV